MTDHSQGSGGPASPAAPRLAARRPLLDRRLEVYGYELVAAVPNAADMRLLTDGKLCFVNLPSESLEAASLALPRDHVVLQVDRAATTQPDVPEMLRSLSDAGYMIAISDFVVRPDALGLLELASFISFDAGRLSTDHLRAQVKVLAGYPVKTIAANIPDYRTFEALRELDVDVFGGAFFRRPRHVLRSVSDSAHLQRLRLIAGVQRPGLELEQLDDLISTDMGISYRLLRLLNSAYFGLPHPVGSVHHALVMLGGDRVRLWTVLIALAEIDDRPDELVRTALIRARMCELIAAARADVRPETAFSAGLFSLVEAFADAGAEEVIDLLGLPPAVREAVLDRQGPLGGLLADVTAYTGGAFDVLDVSGPAAEERLRDAYMRAVTWADETHRITRALRRG